MTTIGLTSVFQRLAQDKARLRLRTVGGIDDQQHAVHHVHDTLDLAAEIGVAGSIDDIDVIIFPLKRGVLGANGDSFFALEIHRIHHAFLNLLIGAKGTGLSQQSIDERRLAVIDVGDNGDVANFIHERVLAVVRRPR